MTDRDDAPQRALAPKPYELIELPGGEPERIAPVGHEMARAGLLTGRLELELEALSPVHVATGLLMPPQNDRRPLARELVRIGGVPVIPGSSFKGGVRAVVEAISRSCLRATRARELPREYEGCRSKERLCVACRMFGAQDFQGLLRFGDMRLVGQAAQAVQVVEVPQFFQPRVRERTYLRNGRVAGRKFYMHGSKQALGNSPIEACRTGSRFDGVVDFENLSAAQLGLLLTALGQSPVHPFALKLGGAKPACYGSLRVTVRRVSLVSEERYLAWDAPADQDGNPETYLTAASALVVARQLQALAHTLRWPNERECPAGNY